MKPEDRQLLMALTQAARRPGVTLYHYAILNTLDDEGRPYSRARSPTINLPFDMVIKMREMQLAGKMPTRYTEEKLKNAIELDTQYKDIINKHAWEILCYDETVQDKSLKQSVKNMKRDLQAHMVCLEAIVQIDPVTKGLAVQRGTKDILIDLDITNISVKGEDLYDHRSAWYLLLLADTHLAAYENKEKRFFHTTKEIWTGKHTSIKMIEQSKGGLIEILEDFPFTTKIDGLKFIKKHNFGTIAIKDHNNNRATGISASFDIDLSISEGVFWVIETEKGFVKEIYNQITSNLSNNDPFVSINTVAFGMEYELGIAIEGEITLSGEEIEAYKAKNNIAGVVAFISPRRITNISPSEARRQTVGIIYNEWE